MAIIMGLMSRFRSRALSSTMSSCRPRWIPGNTGAGWTCYRLSSPYQTSILHVHTRGRLLPLSLVCLFDLGARATIMSVGSITLLAAAATCCAALFSAPPANVGQRILPHWPRSPPTAATPSTPHHRRHTLPLQLLQSGTGNSQNPDWFQDFSKKQRDSKEEPSRRLYYYPALLAGGALVGSAFGAGLMALPVIPATVKRAVLLVFGSFARAFLAAWIDVKVLGSALSDAAVFLILMPLGEIAKFLVRAAAASALLVNVSSRQLASSYLAAVASLGALWCAVLVQGVALARRCGLGLVGAASGLAGLTVRAAEATASTAVSVLTISASSSLGTQDSHGMLCCGSAGEARRTSRLASGAAS